jgi:hypothetical protein
MAIADTTLLLEGQQDFSGGMDASLSPTLIPANTVATAVNITFRGGRPSTRPGFRQVPLSSPASDPGLNLFVNSYFQGSHFYLERRQNYNSSIIAVTGGNVIRIDLGTLLVTSIYPVFGAGDILVGRNYTIKSIGTSNFTLAGASSNSVGTSFTAISSTIGTGTVYATDPQIDRVENCYFVQAEKYIVIQNGKNTPLIWDGDDLWVSGVGPSGSTGNISQLHTIGSGTVMAYGQGRLFVANIDRTEITAGDLVFGGSTDQVSITSGVGTLAAATYSITTATPHGYLLGDIITISGHSSSNGVNGTWECGTGTTGSTIVIDVASPSSATSGTGGYVARANAGSESDLLRFTETTYLSEGGTLQVPALMGKINGLVFVPVQDTGTGQGDLLVFCERGTASFAVSVPRVSWVSTPGFQRIAFPNIGATGYKAITTNNGDVFFRAFDGLRTYRNARAELNTYGQVPMSAEMNSVLNYDSPNLLDQVSAIIFDNRLLFTASPTVSYTGVSNTSAVKKPVTFSKLIVLDFTTLSTAGAKRLASYDGMWGGLAFLQLISGIVGNQPKAYVFAYDNANGGINGLWELTTNDIYDYPSGVSPQRINSILETKAFSFGSPLEQKRMIRADFWLSNLRGTLDANVYWRPDQYPCWREWHSFTRCATTDNCIESGASTSIVSAGAGTTKLSFTKVLLPVESPDTFRYRLTRAGLVSGPITYGEDPDASFQENEILVALTTGGFPAISVTRSGTFPDYEFVITETLTSEFAQYTLVPVKSAGEEACLSNFTLKNLQPQYRPQIRMPTPSEESDPIISRPFIYGNDFQLRLEFTGHFEMNRILILGQRMLEQYQGTDNVQVL